MFPNLRAELARKNMNLKDLSAGCNIIYSTLVNKMNGGTDWTYSDIIKITNFFGMKFEYLFQKEEQVRVD